MRQLRPSRLRHIRRARPEVLHPGPHPCVVIPVDLLGVSVCGLFQLRLQPDTLSDGESTTSLTCNFLRSTSLRATSSLLGDVLSDPQCAEVGRHVEAEPTGDSAGESRCDGCASTSFCCGLVGRSSRRVSSAPSARSARAIPVGWRHSAHRPCVRPSCRILYPALNRRPHGEISALLWRRRSVVNPAKAERFPVMLA